MDSHSGGGWGSNTEGSWRITGIGYGGFSEDHGDGD